MRASIDNPYGDVVSVNDKFLNLEYTAYQFRYDSVHGKFMGIVDIDKETNSLVINGTMKIKFFTEMKPVSLP